VASARVPSSSAGTALTVAGVLAVVRRPHLWGIALAQGWRLRRRGWWRSSPFLPVPDAAYLRFRMITAYGGDGSAAVEPDDLVRYLEWCRDWPHARG
jgi:hypothetical protein